MKRTTTLLHAFVCFLLIFIDQISKYFVRLYVKGNTITLWDGVFSFHYHENRGSVWGILQGKVDILLFASVVLFAILR